MTQLTFDFSADLFGTQSNGAAVCERSRPVQRQSAPARRRNAGNQPVADVATRPSQGRTRVARSNSRLEMPTVARGGEPQRLGDLAQLVLARYDIVRQRRAARLAREAARRRAAGLAVS